MDLVAERRAAARRAQRGVQHRAALGGVDRARRRASRRAAPRRRIRAPGRRESAASPRRRGSSTGRRRPRARRTTSPRSGADRARTPRAGRSRGRAPRSGRRARPRRRCGRSASTPAAIASERDRRLAERERVVIARDARRGRQQPIDVAEVPLVRTLLGGGAHARHRRSPERCRQADAAHAGGLERGEVPRLALHADHEVDRLGHRRADRAHGVEVGQRRREQHVGAGRLVRLQARDRVGEVGLAAEEVLGARGDRESRERQRPRRPHRRGDARRGELDRIQRRPTCRRCGPRSTRRRCRSRRRGGSSRRRRRANRRSRSRGRPRPAARSPRRSRCACASASSRDSSPSFLPRTPAAAPLDVASAAKPSCVEQRRRAGVEGVGDDERARPGVQRAQAQRLVGVGDAHDGCGVRLSSFARSYCFCAGSQCSAILPSSMRNMSNQVVVYFFVGSFGSASSRAKLRTTRSPSATIATSGALTRASIGAGFRDLGEEIDERGAAGRHVRVVLDVRLGHVLVGELHVPALEHLAPEVVDESLVGGEARIGCWRGAPPGRWPPAPRPVPTRPRRQEARRRDNTARRVCAWDLRRSSERSRFDPASRRGIVSSPHVIRSRSLRRHRRPHLAQADAGAVPGLPPRQAARRRPHPRRRARGAQRRRLPRLHQERFVEVDSAKRPSDEEFARFAELLHYRRMDLSQPGDYARPEGLARRRRGADTGRSLLPRDQPAPVPGRSASSSARPA